MSGKEGDDAKTYQERQVAKAVAESGSGDESSAEEATMKPEDRYHRFVRCSDEDQCYIGYCPDLYVGGVCHGDGEEAAYAELCGIVGDEIAHRLAKGEALPQATVRATRDVDIAAA